MLAAKCYECHNADKMKGDVDLKQFAGDPDVATEFEIWTKVKDTIDNGDMPPRKSKQLTAEEKAGITGWVQHSLDLLAEAKSGDPGPVTMRRLTNAEYDYTIRDLTGREYALAKEFQTDGGGGEGFTNTGDVLFTSPAAIDKYFGAARKLADHATVMPGTGIVFHPQRIGLRGFEQIKAQAQQGLYVWYQQKAAPHLPKDFDPMREGDYMLACWKHKNQNVALEQLAKDLKLNIHFLRNWWNLVNSTEPQSRYLDLVRVSWRELPADEKAAQERIKGIEADLLRLGQRARAQGRGQAVGGLDARLPGLTQRHPGAAGGSQVLGERQQQHRVARGQALRGQPGGHGLGQARPEIGRAMARIKGEKMNAVHRLCRGMNVLVRPDLWLRAPSPSGCGALCQNDCALLPAPLRRAGQSKDKP